MKGWSVATILTSFLLLSGCDIKKSFEIPEGKVGLVGYGSLISKKSMEITLGRPYEGPFEIVHLNGYIRNWTLFSPNTGIVYCMNEADTVRPEVIHFLNIEKSESISMNACMFIINETDLPGFDKRERRYKRIEISDIIDEFKITGGKVFTYVGLPDFTGEAEINNISKNAIGQFYLDKLEDGFTNLGAEFRQEFFETTIPYHESLVLECFRED